MKRLIPALLTAFALAFAAIVPAQAGDRDKAQALVERANATLLSFLSDSKMQWIRDEVHNAKAVMIVPNNIKGGFILGGSGGNGVMMVRDSSDYGWSEPAFYRLGSVTFGLQAGAEASEIILVVMTQDGVNHLMNTNATLGGDVSVTAGPIGAGAKAQTSDILAFSRSKGLYGGINLEGAVIKVHNKFNRAYYNTYSITPEDILLRHRFANPGADHLQHSLARLIPSLR